MRKVSNKGFTLVELIIVITILAILATIAFISFQGYSAETRDAKQKSDLGNLVKQLELKTSVGGVDLKSFVSGTGSQTAGVNIAGTGAVGCDSDSDSNCDYKAGVANLIVLGAPDNYKHPTTGSGYKLGITTKAGGQYEFKTTLEKDELEYTVGTYKPRTSTEGTLGYFYLKDTVTIDGSNTGTITKISLDLGTIYTSTETSGTGVASIELALSDSGSLVY